MSANLCLCAYIQYIATCKHEESGVKAITNCHVLYQKSFEGEKKIEKYLKLLVWNRVM